MDLGPFPAPARAERRAFHDDPLRVKPEQLKEVARQILRAAAEMRETGRGLLSATEGLPSYDGQFGTKVRGIGAEAFARLNPTAEAFEALGVEVERVAERFEGPIAPGVRPSCAWRRALQP